MLKENLSIELTAERRELTIGTVVNHIEKLKGLKLIDSSLIGELKLTLPKEDFDVILAELQKSEDGKLKSVYDKLKGQYSYITIQLVRLFVEF